jgi:hypothetical protein
VPERDTPTARAHPQLEVLPDWPTRTIAVLATVNQGPHAIPISAPLRAGDRRILLSLRHGRGSLERLRSQPRVALAVLTEGNIAFSAHGHARIVRDRLAGASDYAAVAIDVERIDDHRQAEFRVESGIVRSWVDENEQSALARRVDALRQLVTSDGMPSGLIP